MPSAPAPEAGETAPAPAPPTRFRDNLEAVVVAVILALLIRQFAMEAFVIPTGSMAPTLLGAHVDLVCSNCGHGQAASENVVARAREACPKCRKPIDPLPVDAQLTGREVKCDACGTTWFARGRQRAGDGTRTVRTRCGHCGKDFETRLEDSLWPWGDVSRGDRILVNKFIYKLRPPRRWEVIVFKFPGKPELNYIKRLIGLPGEKIEIRNGDIFIDDRIARKPPEAQRAMWRLVHDSRLPEKDGGGDRGPAWKIVSGNWSLAEGRFEARAGADDAWLAYGRKIKDLNAYNEIGNTGGQSTVGDLRLAFQVTVGTASHGAGIRARLTEDDDQLEIFYPCTASGTATTEAEATLTHHGKVLGRAKVEAAVAGLVLAFDLARVDDGVRLEVNGAEVFAFDLPSAEGLTQASGASFGARGTSAVFESVTLSRDVYYLPFVKGSTSVRFPYRVPEKGYFVLGDNSSNSTDSRVWETLTEDHIVGRAFLVFWPAIPFVDWAVRMID